MLRSSKILTLVFGLCIVGSGDAVGHLPADVPKCNAKDPAVNECLKTAIIAGMQKFKTGQKSLGLLPLNPLSVDQVTLDLGTDGAPFLFKAKNIKVYGLTDSIIKSVDFKPDKFYLEFHSVTPNTTLIFNYEAKGRLVVLPVNGEGPGSFLFTDLDVIQHLEGKPFKKDGRVYWNVTKYEFKFDAKKLDIELEGLLKGNKQVNSGAVFTYGRSRFANNVASYFFIRNDPIAEISCGDEHTAIVCQNGRVFTFGSNSWGQLGLGHKNTITMPSCMKSLKPEKANHIACGKSHTVISTVSGKVFTCGSNANGQLGIPEVTEKTTPTQVTGIAVKNGGIKQVSAGCLHSACLTDDGKVYVWGTNTDGQLGLGDVVETADVPSVVKLPKPAVYISCGYYHTAFVTDDGKLYICGEGENGKLGLSETRNVFTPTPVDIDSPVDFVACGGNHTIAVTRKKDVYAFGSNLRGQLGLENKVESSAEPKLVSALTRKQIYSVACGESHTAFISGKGEFYVCGDGRYGKLCKDVNDDVEDASEFLPQRVDRFENYDVTLVACGGCHTMVHAAIKTSVGDQGSPNGNDAVDAVSDHIGSKSPNPNLQAGDSVNRLPRSARLPPLHVGQQNGSILDSPSVEVAPGNVDQLTATPSKKNTGSPPKIADKPTTTVTATPPKSVTATPLKTVTPTPPKSVTATPPKSVTATPPKTVPATPPKSVTTPPKTVPVTPPKSVTTPPKTVPVTPPKSVTTPPKTVPVTPPKTVTATLPKSVPATFKDIKDSNQKISELEEKAHINGSDSYRPTEQSLDEVLNKLNVKDASELNFIAVENEERTEEEDTGDSIDKLAASGTTVILSDAIKIESEHEPTAETTKEEVEEKDGEETLEDDEGKPANGEVEDGEGNPANGEAKDGEGKKENREDINAKLEIANEDEKGKGNEVIAEQTNDGDGIKESKKPTTAENVESRVSKFLSTFRRKKLSEENLSLSPAWTTVDGKISSDNTILNNRKTDKPGATQAKYGQPQRSKACVIL